MNANINSSISPEYREDNFYSTNNIRVFQPKLLKLKNRNYTNEDKNSTKDYLLQQSKFNKTNDFYKSQKQKITNKISPPHKEQENSRKLLRDKKLEKFYENPLLYIDYLIKKQSSSINNKESDMIQLLLNEFNRFSTKTKEDIVKTIEREMKKIEEDKFPLRDKKNNTSMRVSNRSLKSKRNIHENEISSTNSQKEPQAQEIVSEPVDQSELISKFNLFPNDIIRFESIINTRPDIKNYLLKDRYSSLGHNSLMKKTLDCLKGENIEIPTENFLQVNDLNLNDINATEMEYTKNLLCIQRQFDYIKENSENTMIDHMNKTAIKEKEIFNNLIEKSHLSLEKMQKATEISEEMLENLKNKLNEDFNKDLVNLAVTQLNLQSTNLDKIKQDLNSNFLNTEQQNIAMNLERLKIIEENNRRADEDIKKILRKEGIEIEEEKVEDSRLERIDTELSDKALDQLYDKFKKYEELKKKKNKYNSVQTLNNRSKSKKIIRPTTSMK